MERSPGRRNRRPSQHHFERHLRKKCRCWTGIGSNCSPHRIGTVGRLDRDCIRHHHSRYRSPDRLQSRHRSCEVDMSPRYRQNSDSPLTRYRPPHLDTGRNHHHHSRCRSPIRCVLHLRRSNRCPPGRDLAGNLDCLSRLHSAHMGRRCLRRSRCPSRCR